MPHERRTTQLRQTGWTHLQFVLQKVSLSLELFQKNELLNHAGAAGFFFLLSITPVFLVVIFAFDRYLLAFPEASENLFEFLQAINANLNKEFLVRLGLLNVGTAAVGLFGVINLLWAGRCILTAIQRGLMIIFKSEEKRSPLWINIISFAILFLMVFLFIVAVFVVLSLKYLQTASGGHPLTRFFFGVLLPVASRTLPPLTIFGAIFLAYRFLPYNKPRTRSSLTSALGCALAIIALQLFFANFFIVARYSMIYGVLGSLILMVLLVYFSFVCFYFFAEYTYVSDKIDVFLIGRLYLAHARGNAKGRRVEKFLFNHPKRLLEKYSKYYAPGEILFRAGDRSREIYFVYQGTIGIYLEDGDRRRRIATLGAGEVFGEMAYLLDETRMAAAVAETEAVLIEIMPDVFEELLGVNNEFARDLIQVLTDRLRKVELAPKP